MTVPLDRMWPLTMEWYGDRLSGDFQPKPITELQSMLSRAGLVSDFWELPV